MTTNVDRGTLVARAFAWNTAFQIFETVITFAAMLVLVRIIAPAEYGRAGAVLGIVTLLNSLSFGVFVAHALQLPASSEPDWPLHWSVGLYVQISLMLACHGVAILCSLTETYRPIAPLLHVSAFGFLLDWPAQLNAAMLRRAMDFRRLRVIGACSLALKLLITVSGGLLGGGAYALVIGAHVVSALPLGFDLLVIRRWRPPRGWWGRPDWTRYGLPLRFGGQQGASALFLSARKALEGVVLPMTLGYAAVGLLGRAQALFGMGVGRITFALGESVYPLLAVSSTDRLAFARLATFFAQTVAWLAIPGGVYLAWDGAAISRLLYGAKWVDADPLIVPAVVAGMAHVGLIVGWVLLADNRLRQCLLLDATAAGLALPSLLVVWAGGTLTDYAWALAGAEVTVAVVTMTCASRYFTAGWIRIVLLAPAVASLVALTAMVAVEGALTFDVPVTRVIVGGTVYGATVLLAYRVLFPHELAAVVGRLPGGRRAGSWLRLAFRAQPSHLGKGI